MAGERNYVMRVATSVDYAIKVNEENDMNQHYVGTNDSEFNSLGGESEHLWQNGSAATMTDKSKVVTATGGAGTAIGTGSISDWIFIKHTGYTTADKTTASAGILTVGFTDAGIDTGNCILGFKIFPGGAICLSQPGDNMDNCSEIFLESRTYHASGAGDAGADIYCEIKVA
jgi:hypothetical protein